MHMAGGATESSQGDASGNGPSSCSQIAQHAGARSVGTGEFLFWQFRHKLVAVTTPLPFLTLLETDAQAEQGRIGAAFSARDRRKENMSG